MSEGIFHCHVCLPEVEPTMAMIILHAEYAEKEIMGHQPVSPEHWMA